MRKNLPPFLFFPLLLAASSLLFPVIVKAEPTPMPTMGALERLAERAKAYTLKNGLRVVFYKRGTAPVFSAVVAVRVGGTDEVPGMTGISHMLEHMAFKGTSSLGTKNYAREKPLLDELEEIASITDSANNFTPELKRRWDEIHRELSTLWDNEAVSREYDKRGGEGLNATTDKEFTKYFVSLPSQYLEFWASMETERLVKPVMRQFYQERDVVREERRMRSEDDPGGKLYEQFLGVAFLQHPYRNPVIGYDEDIKRLKASELYDFHSDYYVASNMAVAIVGDVDPERDIETIRPYFEKIPDGKAILRPKIEEVAPLGSRTLTLKLPTSPQIIVGWPKPQWPNKDDPPLSVLAEILAGGSTSRLIESIVKRQRIATAIDLDEGPGYAYPGLMFLFSIPRSPHTNREVLAAVDEIITKFIATGPTDEELVIAKKRIARSYLDHLDSSMSIAQNFTMSHLLYGDWAELVKWYDAAMDVTREDVLRVAKEYLSPDKRTIGFLDSK